EGAALAEGDVLAVGVPVDRCPMVYLDADTGAVVGIGADLMRAAAAAAGYKVNFVIVEEASLKEALDNPAYDVILPFGSAIPSASGHPSAVSENLIQTPFTLVTEGTHVPTELNALRVGMLRSLSGGAETVRQLYPGIAITLYETMPESVRALRAGEVDALLHNSYVWSYVLQKPSYGDLRVQPSAMFSMDFRAGTLDTPEGRARIARLNGGIAALSDTLRQAIALDYTSRRLYRYGVGDYLYQYGLVLLLTGLLFVALIVIAVQKVRAVRMEQAEKLRRLIDHDPLTGVYSLSGFRKQVEALLRAHPDTPYLLCYVNIRNFKYINDSLGMASGDALLRYWADRTQRTLSDAEAMCRIEADHFAVLRRAGGEDKLRRDDAEVVDSVRNYFVDRGGENRVQVCGGVYVLTPEDYRHIDVDHMLDFARVAEKRVRDTHKDGYAFYNPEQWEKGKRVAEVVSHLTQALSAGEFEVWYQPQVNYRTGGIVGAEALCRWNHAKLGWIPPAEFIPMLEEAGLIYELDRFVWDRVCRDLQRFNRMGLRQTVSVNLSRCDIREDENIPRHFDELARRYGLSPDQLHVEITETAYVENPALLIQTTERLRALGFQVEMDDFGSGYSSLHMLKEVPVDRIKLDLYFLTETGDQERGRTIVTSMVQMGHALGMGLIAEGVESVEQARFLQGIGCDEMQGFYFHRPMPMEAFEDLIKKDTTGDEGNESKDME
ncbi:MAG: EAL domain-containing protein, partial [Clostridia bacterium]|nr:EAL domain-containing protein [Clostridia bacterium]